MNTECTCVSKVERELAQLSFAMDDLRLFLDTHPCDKAALAAHEEVRARRGLAVKQYERLIGPVNFYDAGGTCTWNWTCAPWPWETEDENDVELCETPAIPGQDQNA